MKLIRRQRGDLQKAKKALSSNQFNFLMQIQKIIQCFYDNPKAALLSYFRFVIMTLTKSLKNSLFADGFHLKKVCEIIVMGKFQFYN